MRNDQKLTPKYWVVHSKDTEDVDVRTLAKGREQAIDCWVEATYRDRFGRSLDPDPAYRDNAAVSQILGEFHERDDLEVSLIEIKEVDMS